MIYNHSSEHMHEIPDNSVHLIVTSPPYPMIEKWDELFGTILYNDQCDYLRRVWIECYRILIEGGINIGDATRNLTGNFFQCYPNFARTIIDCRNIGFIYLIPIFWKKISNRPNAFLGSGMLPTNGYISQDCEYIAILRKGLPRKFPVKDENRYKSAFTKTERDKWFQQIWEIKGKSGSGINGDSSFPDEIPYRLIRMFSVIGDTVVDPFSGSGTTEKVAVALNREFIGYEIKSNKQIEGEWF
jgi:modification methylase